MPPKASKRKAASGYRLPDPIPPGEIVTGLKKDTWRVGKSIGVGGFGEIYLCSQDVTKNVGDDATLAMKIEPHENGPLFVEMNFYIRAAQPGDVQQFKTKKNLKSLGMPVHCGSGSHTFKGEKYRFLIMERFGKDLQKIFQTGKKKFPPKAAFNIAIKVIDTLEYIHSRGYVHNDIKGQNLLLGHGRTKENDVYLVDFGLVSKYQRDGVHLEYKPDARKAHDGTIEYTSRDAHIGAHSRRSDLEILGYNLVHWMSGILPWMDNLTNANYVHMQKKGFMSDIPAFLKRCFGDADYPDVLLEFLTYVANLEFDTEPDYDKCRDMFKKAMKKLKIPLDGKLDFATPKSPAKKVGTSPVKNVKGGGKEGGAGSRKKKTVVVSESEDEEEVEEEEEEEELPKKRKTREKAKPSPPVKRETKPRTSKKREVPSVSVGCQTSPGFVKMAKALKRGRNPEMDEFAARAIKAAKSATKKKTTDCENDSGLSNPTPAMLELMEKKAESAKKPQRPRRTKS